MQGGRRGPSRGRRRSATAPPSGPEQERLIGAWFAGRVPESWYEGSPTIEIDGDEILVVGSLAPPSLAAGTDQRPANGACQGWPIVGAWVISMESGGTRSTPSGSLR